jgi:predicted metal-dependent hydrolase
MRRRQEPLDRIAAQYAGYVARGIVLQVRNGEIEISTPEGTVNEALRRQVERDKAALIKHIQAIEAVHDETLGMVLDNTNELAF